MTTQTDDYEVERGRKESGLLWLPANMAKYYYENMCKIEFSAFTHDVLNGYGKEINYTLTIYRTYVMCARCGYHSLWNPDPGIPCQRHTFGKRGMDAVFSYSWRKGDGKLSLEAAFDKWLSMQPTEYGRPTVRWEG